MLWVRVCLFVYTTALCTLSLVSISNRALPIQHIDKLWHFCAFSILSLLAAYASRTWRQYYSLLAIGFALGIAIELAQANFTNHRLGEWQDQFANSVGLLWVCILAQSNKLPKLVFSP